MSAEVYRELARLEAQEKFEEARRGLSHQQDRQCRDDLDDRSVLGGSSIHRARSDATSSAGNSDPRYVATTAAGAGAAAASLQQQPQQLKDAAIVRSKMFRSCRIDMEARHMVLDSEFREIEGTAVGTVVIPLLGQGDAVPKPGEQFSSSRHRKSSSAVAAATVADISSGSRRGPCAARAESPSVFATGSLRSASSSVLGAAISSICHDGAKRGIGMGDLLTEGNASFGSAGSAGDLPKFVELTLPSEDAACVSSALSILRLRRLKHRQQEQYERYLTEQEIAAKRSQKWSQQRTVSGAAASSPPSAVIAPNKTVMSPITSPIRPSNVSFVQRQQQQQQHPFVLDNVGSASNTTIKHDNSITASDFDDSGILPFRTSGGGGSGTMNKNKRGSKEVHDVNEEIESAEHPQPTPGSISALRDAYQRSTSQRRALRAGEPGPFSQWYSENITARHQERTWIPPRDVVVEDVDEQERAARAAEDAAFAAMRQRVRNKVLMEAFGAIPRVSAHVRKVVSRDKQPLREWRPMLCGAEVTLSSLLARSAIDLSSRSKAARASAISLGGGHGNHSNSNNNNNNNSNSSRSAQHDEADALNFFKWRTASSLVRPATVYESSVWTQAQSEAARDSMWRECLVHQQAVLDAEAFNAPIDEEESRVGEAEVAAAEDDGFEPVPLVEDGDFGGSSGAGTSARRRRRGSTASPSMGEDGADESEPITPVAAYLDWNNRGGGGIRRASHAITSVEERAPPKRELTKEQAAVAKKQRAQMRWLHVTLQVAKAELEQAEMVEEQERQQQLLQFARENDRGSYSNSPSATMVASRRAAAAAIALEDLDDGGGDDDMEETTALARRGTTRYLLQAFTEGIEAQQQHNQNHNQSQSPRSNTPQQRRLRFNVGTTEDDPDAKMTLSSTLTLTQEQQQQQALMLDTMGTAAGEQQTHSSSSSPHNSTTNDGASHQQQQQQQQQQMDEAALEQLREKAREQSLIVEMLLKAVQEDEIYKESTVSRQRRRGGAGGGSPAAAHN